MQKTRARYARASALRFFLVLPVAVLCLALAPSGAFSANATIGLYSDSNGYSCSFSGNNAGPVTAYVVIKPGSSGIRGARFSAPIPSCFDATFVSEVTPDGVVSVGDSQTGISVSSGHCETDPFQVLQITYMAASGTTPCCAYPIQADPFTGTLEAIDCAYASAPIITTTSRFNADASCACGSTPPSNLPPDPPFNPNPTDQATFISQNTQLRWQCSDPGALTTTCDLYFGVSPDPPLVVSDMPVSGNAIYTPGPLEPQTPYFWRVVVRNSAHLETPGPLWHFTTYENQAPAVYNTSPNPGATTLPITPTLVWSAIDPDGDSMTFDVYLGPGDTPLLVASGLTQKSYTPAVPLAYATQYSWRVTATDSHQHTTTSATWSFTTKAENEPPAAPKSPVPANGAANISTSPTLSWTASDPENQALKYDVYFGEAHDPGTGFIGLYTDNFGGDCSFNGQNGLVTAYVVAQLPSTQRVQTLRFSAPIPSCFDATLVSESVYPGATATGSSQTGIAITLPQCLTSEFTVMTITYMMHGETAPCCEYPVLPYPGADHIEATDCSSAPTTVAPVTSHFNANNTCDCMNWVQMPPLVASNIAANSFSPGALPMNTRYFWKVVARDPGGLEAAGPFWEFRTKPNQPPAVPSNPSPAHLSTEQSEHSTLKWTCSDPEGDALTYDVAFGTAQFPSVIARNLASPSYDPGPLALNTTYRWIITARDALGNETTAPRWAFKTRTGNQPPNAPTIVSPANGATNQALNTIVKWNATDPENDALNYDVYFGADASPPLVASHVTAKSYDPGALQTAITYRWKIVVWDANGSATVGPMWTFTTTNTTSLPPHAPSNPIPPDGGTAGVRPLLRWQGSDPEGDVLTYTVWLLRGEPFDGDIVGSWTTMDTFFQVPQDLTPGLMYSWFVGASDGHSTTYSQFWFFHVGGGELPVAFDTFEARQSGAAVEVRWKLSSDEAMESFTLYRRAGTGTESLIAQGRVDGVSGSYFDNSIDPGATYKYELLIRTTAGNEFRSQIATVATRALELALYQNQPNPFNPETTIRYDLPAGATRVRLLIVDANGRRVRTLVDETQSGGARSVVWNGRDDGGNPVSSGVYFYVLDAGKQRLTKKLVLLK